MKKFPETRMDDSGEFARGYFEALAYAAMAIDRSQIKRAADMLSDALTRGANIFVCGNGGSAAIADHLTCDFLKGIRTGTDLRPKVISLVSTISLVTAIANDIGYAEAFRFQLESLAKPGDLLIAVTSSGNSENILLAVDWANSHQMTSIALTGFDGGSVLKTAHVAVHVPIANYGVVEDLHQSVMHLLAQYVRHRQMNDAQREATKF